MAPGQKGDDGLRDLSKAFPCMRGLFMEQDQETKSTDNYDGGYKDTGWKISR